MKVPMRIMQVLEATAGGTRRHLMEIVSALEPEEFCIHIVCSIERDPSFLEDVVRYRDHGHRVTVLEMSPGLRPLRDGLASRRLKQLLRSEPCDILHLHSAKAGFIGRIAARGLGCRVIYSPHAFPFLRNDRAPRRFAYRLAEQMTAPWTDLLLAVSEAEGRLANEIGFYPEERIAVLPNALDVREFDKHVAKPRDRGGFVAPRRFGLIGELRPQKGTFLFLEAARRLRNRGTPIRIVLPRAGPELSAATRFIERHNLEALTEFVPTPDSLRPLLERCDVAVLPSLWEGLPYSLLEALALRLPVIASDLPVFEDLVRPIDSRLIFASQDIDGLADRLALWDQLPASDLACAGARGRAWTTDNHGPEEWKSGLREIYRSFAPAVSEPTPRPARRMPSETKE